MSEDPLMRKKAAMYPMNKKYGGLRPGTPTQARGPRVCISPLFPS